MGEVEERLARLSQPKGDLMMLVGQTVRSQTVIRFAATKTDPSGARWAPWKRNYPKSGSILVRSNNLARSIQADNTDNMARVFTNVFYGAYHQFGTKKMSARAFIGLEEGKDTEQVRMVVENYISELLA